MGKLRQNRLTNGLSSRLATPRWASASSASPGIPLAAATATTGPLAKPPPPTATSGRVSLRMRRTCGTAAPSSLKVRA